jgi:hypothetical protein
MFLHVWVGEATVEQNAFGSLFSYMLGLVKGTVEPKKYDLTALKSVIKRI